MRFKSRTPRLVAILLAFLTVVVVMSSISNLAQNYFSWFSIIALSAFVLALANFALERFAGGYFFGDDELTIKSGVFRHRIPYNEIRKIDISEGKLTDFELDRGQKSPVTIVVRDKEGFLQEFYRHRPDLDDNKKDAE